MKDRRVTGPFVASWRGGAFKLPRPPTEVQIATGEVLTKLTEEGGFIVFACGDSYYKASRDEVLAKSEEI